MTQPKSNDAGLDAIRGGLIRPAWQILLFTSMLAIGGALLVHGFDFYTVPLGRRPEHEAFRELSPSGLVGQAYGFIGAGLIFTNLFYLVRRKLVSWPLGSLRVWLEIHVFTGLTGSVLILFHSAFQLRTELATLTAVSLALVVVTGMLGRYLVSMAPKVEAWQLETNIASLNKLRPELGNRIQEGLAQTPPTQFSTSQSLISTLMTLPTWLHEARARRATIRTILAATPVPKATNRRQARHVRRTLRKTRKLAGREIWSEASISILRVWRRLHRFFAILMLLSVAVHIGVAWYYGYRWIFSE